MSAKPRRAKPRLHLIRHFSAVQGSLMYSNQKLVSPQLNTISNSKIVLVSLPLGEDVNFQEKVKFLLNKIQRLWLDKTDFIEKQQPTLKAIEACKQIQDLIIIDDPDVL
jgi:hypothetical protein